MSEFKVWSGEDFLKQERVGDKTYTHIDVDKIAQVFNAMLSRVTAVDNRAAAAQATAHTAMSFATTQPVRANG